MVGLWAVLFAVMFGIVAFWALFVNDKLAFWACLLGVFSSLIIVFSVTLGVL